MDSESEICNEICNDNEIINNDIISDSEIVFSSDDDSCLNPDEIGPKDQFYMKAQSIRKIDSENRNSHKTLYSSGILPFYVKNKTIYFLIGKDHDGNWSDFGGRSESQDMGRWDMTASREFYEESIGSVMDIQTMMSRLQNSKNYIKLKSKTLNGSSYYMYLVKIPYKDIYRINFHSTLAFMKYIKYNNKNKTIDYKFLEKNDIQWISYETLKISLEQSNNYPLRPVFKKTIEHSLPKILEFCSKFYDSNVFDKVFETNTTAQTTTPIPVCPTSPKEIQRVVSEKPVNRQYYNSNFFRRGSSGSTQNWRN